MDSKNKKRFRLLAFSLIIMISLGLVFETVADVNISVNPRVPEPLNSLMPGIDTLKNSIVKETVAEIGPRILLVNFWGGPEWDEDSKYIVEAAFRALPDNLKILVTNDKPLRIALLETIGNYGGFYSLLTNTIYLSRDRHIKSFPLALERRPYLFAAIFHEFGHAVDVHLSKDSPLSFPWNRYSYNEWKEFLDTHPNVKEIALNFQWGIPLFESFAELIADYVLDDEYFSYGDYATLSLEDKEELVRWLKQDIFTQEPKREWLNIDLGKYSDIRYLVDYYASKIDKSKGVDTFMREQIGITFVPWIFDYSDYQRTSIYSSVGFTMDLPALRGDIRILSRNPAGTTKISLDTNASGNLNFLTDLLGEGKISDRLENEIRSEAIRVLSDVPSLVKEIEKARPRTNGILSFYGDKKLVPPIRVKDQYGGEIEIGEIAVELKIIFDSADISTGKLAKFVKHLEDGEVIVSGTGMDVRWSGPYYKEFGIYIHQRLGDDRVILR